MKSNSKGLVVVTDLNGTLLDRYTGSPRAALPALQRLAELNVPVIFNSSKTAAEILQLRATLGNHDPFITENGADLYFPEAASPDNYTIKRFGISRNHILHVLSEIAAEQEFRYLAFSTMTIEQLSVSSGLPRNILRLQMQRIYTEPLLWQDTQQNLERFNAALARWGLRCSQSGNLVYINKRVNKATPLESLRSWYQERWAQEGAGNRKTLVLASGDGKSDIPLLESSDIAVLVTTQGKPPLQFRHPRQFATGQEGPGGWNALMLDLLNGDLADLDAALI